MYVGLRWLLLLELKKAVSLYRKMKQTSLRLILFVKIEITLIFYKVLRLLVAFFHLPCLQLALFDAQTFYFHFVSPSLYRISLSSMWVYLKEREETVCHRILQRERWKCVVSSWEITNTQNLCHSLSTCHHLPHSAVSTTVTAPSGTFSPKTPFIQSRCSPLLPRQVRIIGQYPQKRMASLHR